MANGCDFKRRAASFGGDQLLRRASWLSAAVESNDGLSSAPAVTSSLWKDHAKWRRISARSSGRQGSRYLLQPLHQHVTDFKKLDVAVCDHLILLTAKARLNGATA